MSDSKGHDDDDKMPDNEDDYYRWLADKERRENTPVVTTVTVPLEVTLGCVGVFLFGLLVWVSWMIYDRKIRPHRSQRRRIRDLSQSDESIRTDPAGDIDLREGAAADSGAAASRGRGQPAPRASGDAQSMRLTVPSAGDSSSSDLSSTSASRAGESRGSSPSVRRRTPAPDAEEEPGEDQVETTAV